MSTREKNLLLMFLELSKNDKGCTEKWEKVTKKLAKVAEGLGIQDGTEENTVFIELESEITELFQMTKDVYFSFGINAKEVVEDYTLEDAA